ncbi:SusC/RagA family TonB-linked outer membrane protein, partial [uncultured Bacteroides sp.]
MRITLFMLFCVVGILSANDSYAQKTLLNVNSKGKMVSEILNEIEQETEFTFFYNNRQVDVKRRVSFYAKSENIFKILDKIFEGTGVVYKVLDKSIILSNSTVNASLGNFLQQGNIKGKVVDTNGEPIIGANVVVVGTSNGTISDVEGNFTISASQGDVLKVSFIGFVDKTVTVAEQTTLQIVLAEDAKTLDEVVVIGYGTAHKSSLTGALSQVSSESFAEQNVTRV